MVLSGSSSRPSRPGSRRAVRRWVAVLAALVAVAVLLVAPRTSAAATTRADASAVTRAPASIELPPWFSDELRALAERYATKAYAKKYAKKAAVSFAKRAVKKWVKSKLRECPDPLPRTYFCTPPPRPRWGRGLALNVRGTWPPEQNGQGQVKRRLRPGIVFWLTCWSQGGAVDNGYLRSNLWYRLTNGLWVNSAWLYTGSSGPIPGTSRC